MPNDSIGATPGNPHTTVLLSRHLGGTTTGHYRWPRLELDSSFDTQQLHTAHTQPKPQLNPAQPNLTYRAKSPPHRAHIRLCLSLQAKWPRGGGGVLSYHPGCYAVCMFEPLSLSLSLFLSHRQASIIALLRKRRHLRRDVDEGGDHRGVVVAQHVHPHVFQLPEQPDARGPRGEGGVEIHRHSN